MLNKFQTHTELIHFFLIINFIIILKYILSISDQIIKNQQMLLLSQIRFNVIKTRLVFLTLKNFNKHNNDK